MAGLANDKIEILRTLFSAAPDRVVKELQRALAGGDDSLADVVELMAQELDDRRKRDLVLAPVLPLFCATAWVPPRLPRAALGPLWRALKLEAQSEIAGLRSPEEPGEEDAENVASHVLDGLTNRVAVGLRLGKFGGYGQALRALEDVGPGGLDALLIALDIAPLVREARSKLPQWIARPDPEVSAVARLAYRDAVFIAETAGPVFFAMLAGALAEPCTILRVIGTVMERPPERYMAASELAQFADQLLEDIDQDVAGFSAFNPSDGVPAATTLAQCMQDATRRIKELDDAVQLDKEGRWGRRVHAQRKTIASFAEARLGEMDREVAAALPALAHYAARAGKGSHTFSTVPDPALVTRAMALLSFAEATHFTANAGGFAAARTKAMVAVGDTLDSLIEAALAMTRAAQPAALLLAESHFAALAELVTALRDSKAGDIVRRRGRTAIAAAEQSEAA